MYNFPFTYTSLYKQLKKAIDLGYQFLTMEDYYSMSKDGKLPSKIIVNRVDIDFSCKKARKLAKIFNKLGIQATFFVRMHAKEYNPFDFENYNCLKFIKEKHNIGLHSEIVDQSAIWNENQEECLLRDIKILETMLNISIKGIASHGGMTGLNNLDFWKDNQPSKYGLWYEAYENTDNFNLFHNSFYISDSEWTQWKCYSNGKLILGNKQSLGEHLEDNHQVIYLLIHPDTYYEEHFYE